MRTALSDIKLWYSPWQMGIPFTEYFPGQEKVRGEGYEFKATSYDCWCSERSGIVLQDIGSCTFLYRGKPIRNLYSLFVLKDRKVQYSTSDDLSSGVTIDVVSIDDIEIEGPAFDLDGEEVEEPS